ncbi:hypothetical protein [Bradyrhizobium cenepequi]
MSRRIVAQQSSGARGLFVSKSGFDAYTAADADLLLNVTSKVSQLILLGNIAAGGGTVALGLHRSPYVFVTSTFDFTGVIGHTLGPGPMRPSPMPGGSSSSATINSNGASMTITAPTKTIYAVYGQAFT